MRHPGRRLGLGLAAASVSLLLVAATAASWGVASRPSTTAGRPDAPAGRARSAPNPARPTPGPNDAPLGPGPGSALDVPPDVVAGASGAAVRSAYPLAESARLATFACGRPGTVVFYSPHQDDETLSMGELIARYAACRWRVEVVLMTDGSTSAARYTIDRYLALMHLPGLTTPAFVAARDREFVAALRQLGVPASHVHFAGWLGGALTVAEAESTMLRYASEFPGALHVTMSQWDVNPDHRALGTALAGLAATRHLQARWVVFHRYWASATFRSSCAIVDDPALLPAIRGAAAAYARWDPRAGWYAVGIISVAHDFLVLRADPRDLACTTPGPIMTRIPGTSLPVLSDRVALTTGSSAGTQ